MRIRRIKLLLWTLTGVLAAGTAAVIVSTVGSLLGPPLDARVAAANKVPSTDSASRSVMRLPPLPELERLCQLDLQRPLYDAPPPAPVAARPPPPPAPLPFKLAGTVIEPGRCRALLQTTDGKIQLTKIGQSVGDGSDGAQVLEITRDSVTLMYHGHEQVLNVEKKESAKGS